MTRKTKFIVCTLKTVPTVEAAQAAVAQSLRNAPARGLLSIATGLILPPEHLAVLTTRYWGEKGVDLTVSFPFDNPAADVRARILSHMNAWGQHGNVRFRETKQTGQVRIARTRGQGYWSYLGTDVLSVPMGEPTMNLEGFTMNTSEAEYRRVVRHETGHTLGFPHEHLRRELVEKLDRDKTIRLFMQMQGWSRQTVLQNVLTPLEETSILGTGSADMDSIMCYHLPGSITRDGKPITGGADIDADDAAFVAKIYPKSEAPPVEAKRTIVVYGAGRMEVDGVRV